MDQNVADAIRSELLDEFISKQWQNNASIQKIRLEVQRLSRCHKSLLEFDGEEGRYDHQLVSEALRGSKNYINCLRLTHLAWRTGARSILELGTNLGISSAYLAVGATTAHPDARLFTGDCSGKRIGIARNLHKECGVRQATFFGGYFDETLDRMIEEAGLIDLCFIDGDHTYDGTLKYFEKIHPHMVAGCFMIFDDILWSDGMVAAWNDVKRTLNNGAFEIDGVGYAVA